MACRDIFVTMARRNRSLIDRQLAMLDEFEAEVDDPDVLSNYYQLDHMATRMRRNSESLLVLANAEPKRRRVKATEIDDVVRAAIGEVEDYRRIEVEALESLQVRGNVVADVSHLVAELLDNATSFSPPDSLVRVGGRRAGDSYMLRIVDNGVGIGVDRLTRAQRAAPRAPDRRPVGRADARHVGGVAARQPPRHQRHAVAGQPGHHRRRAAAVVAVRPDRRARWPAPRRRPRSPMATETGRAADTERFVEAPALARAGPTSTCRRCGPRRSSRRTRRHRPLRPGDVAGRRRLRPRSPASSTTVATGPRRAVAVAAAGDVDGSAVRRAAPLAAVAEHRGRSCRRRRPAPAPVAGRRRFDRPSSTGRSRRRSPPTAPAASRSCPPTPTRPRRCARSLRPAPDPLLPTRSREPRTRRRRRPSGLVRPPAARASDRSPRPRARARCRLRSQRSTAAATARPRPCRAVRATDDFGAASTTRRASASPGSTPTPCVSASGRSRPSSAPAPPAATDTEPHLISS